MHDSPETRSCPVCGNPFKVPPRGRPKKFCSVTCRSKGRDPNRKPPAEPPSVPIDLRIEALREWCRNALVVPPGHPLAGQAMTLPPFGEAFLADVLGSREAFLCVARKNGKSAIVAVYLLGRLVGPWRHEGGGYRGGICSVSREKAAELWEQIRATAEASGLEGLTFRKAPKRIISRFGSVDILSADASAGHASGFNDAIVDELGLLDESKRGLVNGLRSSISARDGRFISLSIQGGGPMSREMLDRRGEDGVAIHHFAAPPDARLDDPAAWAAANPGLACGIKSMSYMQAESRRVLATPNDQPGFLAHELNRPTSPAAVPIVSLEAWNLCAERAKPERSGPAFVGFDLGGSASMTAAACYWPSTGRLDVWGGFGDVPDLMARGQADGVGQRYCAMAEAGALRTWPGRVTPVSEFLAWVGEHLAGENIRLAVADRYRQAEAIDALQAAGLRWPVEWRAQGSGRDGSTDIRSFARAVEAGALRPGESLLLRSAIAESRLRHDSNGNPSLEKGRQRGRIDALAASVLAVSAGSRRQPETWFFVPGDVDRDSTMPGGDEGRALLFVA